MPDLMSDLKTRITTTLNEAGLPIDKFTISDPDENGGVYVRPAAGIDDAGEVLTEAEKAIQKGMPDCAIMNTEDVNVGPSAPDTTEATDTAGTDADSCSAGNGTADLFSPVLYVKVRPAGL